MVFVLFIYSPGITISAFIHVATNGIISFFYMTLKYSIAYMCQVFIHSSVDDHLYCFRVLPILNSVAMETGGACIFSN